MNRIVVKGMSLEINDNGYLANMDEWNADVAEYLARTEGLDMTSPRWAVVRFLQEYYRLHQTAPMVKVIAREIGRKLGGEKGNARYLLELFPGGPGRQACKIAGLPNSNYCI